MSDTQPQASVPQPPGSPAPSQGNAAPAQGAVVGYCRACGKALDAAGVRAAHGTIYCADHAPVEPAFTGTGQPPPFPGGASSATGGADTSSPYSSPYTNQPPPPLPHHDVSPGLAFLLGLIPGVGAVYNGQYAKGLVHVVIVGLLISILSNGAGEGLEPLLSLLLAAFFAYMAFEAFHTAKRRRLGQPVDEFSSVLPGHGGSRFPAAPVVVITLGVVFLLSNLQILEIRRLLRFWPVLMIALGVYMLFARMSGGGMSGGRGENRHGPQ
jgi:hypothetical protein